MDEKKEYKLDPEVKLAIKSEIVDPAIEGLRNEVADTLTKYRELTSVLTNNFSALFNAHLMLCVFMNYVLNLQGISEEEKRRVLEWGEKQVREKAATPKGGGVLEPYIPQSVVDFINKLGEKYFGGETGGTNGTP